MKLMIRAGNRPPKSTWTKTNKNDKFIIAQHQHHNGYKKIALDLRCFDAKHLCFTKLRNNFKKTFFNLSNSSKEVNLTTHIEFWCILEM